MFLTWTLQASDIESYYQSVKDDLINIECNASGTQSTSIMNEPNVIGISETNYFSFDKKHLFAQLEDANYERQLAGYRVNESDKMDGTEQISTLLDDNKIVYNFVLTEKDLPLLDTSEQDTQEFSKQHIINRNSGSYKVTKVWSYKYISGILNGDTFYRKTELKGTCRISNPDIKKF